MTSIYTFGPLLSVGLNFQIWNDFDGHFYHIFLYGEYTMPVIFGKFDMFFEPNNMISHVKTHEHIK